MGWLTRPVAMMPKIENEFEEYYSAVAQDAHQQVKDLTPVDTGRARNGWDVEGAGNALSTGSIKIGNNVEYIGALEDGHSAQAPNGMAARAVANINAKYGLNAQVTHGDGE